MSIEALKEQARGYEQNEEWDKALQAYEEAIRRQDDDDQPDLGLYNRAGDLSTRLGDPIGAIGHYERAVDLYLESELPNNAIAILKKILRNMPDRAEVYLRMGQIRANQGFLTDARDNFLIYAEQMQQAGNMEEAFRALSEFADLAPDDVDVRLSLAEQLEAHEKPDEALEQLGRAYQTLGARGDDEAAAEVATRIHALDEDAELPDIVPVAATLSVDEDVEDAFAVDASDDEIAFDSGFSESAHDGFDADGAGQESWVENTVVADASAAEIELEHELELDHGPGHDAWAEEAAPDEVAAAELAVDTSDDGDAGLEGAIIDFDAIEDSDAPAEAASSEVELDDIEVDLDESGEASSDDELEAALDEPFEAAFEDAFAEDEDEDSLALGIEAETEIEGAFAEDEDEDSLALEIEVQDELEGEFAEVATELDADAEIEAAFEVEEELDFTAEGDGAAADEAEELPLLSFDDEPEGESAFESEQAVAVEVEVDEEVDASATEPSDDEWIGLDEDAEWEGAASFDDDQTWTDGATFEMDSVDIGSLGEEELREYVTAHADSGPAWEQLGRLAVARGDGAAAAEAFEAAHQAHAEERDYQSAMRSVRELLLLSPDSVSHHQRLVEYAHREDDRTLLVSAFLELGDCLERTGEPEKADAVYDKVLEIDPANRRAQVALGTPVEPLPEEESAAEPEDAATSAPSAETPDSDYVDLGSMVLEPKVRTTRWTVEAEEPATEEDFDFQDMLKQFRAKVAEHVDVDDVQAHYDLGTAYKEMGLLDEAISEFQQALRADGRNLATYEVLGQSFMEKGQPEVAIRTLTRATEMPFDVEDELLGIYYYLGRAHEELGNRDDAVEYYEKVFALDINFEDVTERLRSLR